VGQGQRVNTGGDHRLRETLGQLGHRIITADGELVVIDEWGDEERFHKFFENAPKMAQFLEGAGITSPPTVSVFNSHNLPGTF